MYPRDMLYFFAITLQLILSSSFDQAHLISLRYETYYFRMGSPNYSPSINANMLTSRARNHFQSLCPRDSRTGEYEQAVPGRILNGEPRKDHSIFDLIFVIVVKTARASNSTVRRSLCLYIHII